MFCSNIAPSLSSGNHLFYKAEYLGRSCPRQVLAITFEWSALATWNKHLWPALWKPFSGIPTCPPKPGKWGIPEKSFQYAVKECLFQVASTLQSKVMAQAWSIGVKQVVPRTWWRSGIWAKLLFSWTIVMVTYLMKCWTRVHWKILNFDPIRQENQSLKAFKCYKKDSKQYDIFK